jgi:NAD(P)-dependent dehydrogenase (short-subunit alcohol dehydrogenase family)
VVVEAMRRAGIAGAIVNNSSIGSLYGNAGRPVYSATKRAVSSLTVTAAVECGPLGIRVNAIAPGTTMTPLDGELSVRCGDDAFDAAAGSFVFLPRGRPHRFWTPGRPARLLLIAVPGGIEDYFRQINAAASDAEHHRIGERYGIHVVPG